MFTKRELVAAKLDQIQRVVGGRQDSIMNRATVWKFKNLDTLDEEVLGIILEDLVKFCEREGLLFDNPKVNGTY